MLIPHLNNQPNLYWINWFWHVSWCWVRKHLNKLYWTGYSIWDSFFIKYFLFISLWSLELSFGWDLFIKIFNFLYCCNFPCNHYRLFIFIWVLIVNWNFKKGGIIFWKILYYNDFRHLTYFYFRRWEKISSILKNLWSSNLYSFDDLNITPSLMLHLYDTFKLRSRRSCYFMKFNILVKCNFTIILYLKSQA